MLEHGGRLRQAARRYGIALADWTDLSTGINPDPYPVPAIDAAHWNRLPEDDDALAAHACACYGARYALPLPGSQAAIERLPGLFARQDVAMFRPSYAEHAHHWTRAGHRVRPFECETELDAIAAYCGIVVLVQPNNPTGMHFGIARLLALHERLRQRNGTLIVDEAFVDATPEQSLAAYAHRNGLIVLRSLGKFYGLAGARIGFALASPALLEGLRENLGPWPLAGPSRFVASAALQDAPWREAARASVHAAARRLAGLLRQQGVGEPRGTALFQWVPRADAAALHARLARAGILTRFFDAPASLRFGLPANEAQWARLASALARLG